MSPIVKITEPCFTADGVYRNTGAEFHHTGPLEHYMKQIGPDDPAVEDQSEGPPVFVHDVINAAQALLGSDSTKKVEEPAYTVEDLRKKLADLGVKTSPLAKVPSLLEKLAEATGAHNN